VEKLRLEIFG